VEEELRRQKEILQKIFDHIPVMISFFDENGRIELVNREWERTRGWTLKEIQEQNIDVLAQGYPDPKERQIVQDFIAAASGEWADFRTSIRDGRMIDVTWAAVFLSDGTRVSIGKNITEAKRAEEALRQSERDYRALFDQAHDAVLIFEPDHEIILNVNQRACEIYGFSKDEMIGMSIENISEDIPRGKREIKRTLESGRYHQFETVQYRKDGKTMHLEINASAIEYEGKQVILSINRDVTDRKRAEAERNQLMRRLITVQEDERRHISRELHDQMGQYLSALILGLESLNGKAQFSTQAQDDLLYLQDLTEHFEQEVHRFALELRPTALDDLGLHAALSSYVEDWSRSNQKKVTAHFHSTGFTELGLRLSPEVEVALYRIVQEALTNILKHAGARHVSVILERFTDNVRIIIEDDGKGFDVEAMMSVNCTNRRLGLTSMRERAELVGGTLKIDSGAGTTIVASIPIPAAK
jgi:PAS domain S-box-containing protein